MALTFDHAQKRINVPQLDAQPLLIQTLVNSIREEEASERGITYDRILDASGKETLKSGVTTGITASLRSTWAINFEAGAYQATIDGGNLSDALLRIVNTGSPQVLVLASTAASIVATGSGVTAQDKVDIANQVMSAASATPIHADVKRMNGAIVRGTGTAADKWRGDV